MVRNGVHLEEKRYCSQNQPKTFLGIQLSMPNFYTFILARVSPYSIEDVIVMKQKSDKWVVHSIVIAVYFYFLSVSNSPNKCQKPGLIDAQTPIKLHKMSYL